MVLFSYEPVSSSAKRKSGIPIIQHTGCSWDSSACFFLAMFVSSLFIIAETVIPGATTWPSILTNGTKMVMSLAPEIILPGCFQQAQFARHNGNVLKGKLLLCLCALFGLLTMVTLASFIWHFSGAVDN